MQLPFPTFPLDKFKYFSSFISSLCRFNLLFYF